MNAAGRERAASVLVAMLWSAAPLYPSFVALMPVAPPGVSIVPRVVSLMLLLGVVLAIGALLRVLLLDGGGGVVRSPLARAVWCYAGTVALIATIGLSPPFGWLYALFVACTGIGMCALIHWAHRSQFVALMYRAMLWSSAAAAGLAVVLWLLRWPAALYAIGNGRAIGCFVVPGELAGYLGMFLPFALGVALVSSERGLRRIAWFSVGVQALAMLVTFSRAGIVGLALGLTVLIARYGRRALTIYLTAIALLGLLVGLHLLDLHHNPAEDTNRVAIWLAALRVSLLFPLTGVGPGGFALVYPLVRLPQGEAVAFHAHSLLLSTLAETGVVGTIVLVHMWTTFAREVKRLYDAAGPQGRTIALAVFAGCIGTWIQSAIDVVQILVLGLWIPFMGVAYASVAPIPEASEIS